MSENQENNTNMEPKTPVVENNPVPNTQYQQQNYQQPSGPKYSPEYKPLSPWAYVGYNLLFSIPLVGFIMMIVFAFDNSNINRRNFARSFFCAFLIAIIIVLILVILGAIFGFALFSSISTSSGPAAFDQINLN